jgi:hypothetical protein
MENKAAGNAYFSTGDYESAAEQYTVALSKCLAADKVLASTILSNRSLCHLKLDHHSEAEADATAALREDSNNIKALRHRGAARLHMEGQGDLAIADFELFVERGGTMDKKLLKRLTKRQVSADVLNRLAGRRSDDKGDSSGGEKKSPAVQRVDYTVEKIGAGTIFDVWRIQFAVPQSGLQRLSGGRASVQARGGSFELVAHPTAGCVETTVETPDPTPVADEIAQRIYLRLHTSDTFSGMEACVVM